MVKSMLSATHTMFRRFRYTSALKDAFLGGGISNLQDFDNRGWVPGTGANVFVTNHDTERVSSRRRSYIATEADHAPRPLTLEWQLPE